MLNNIVLAGNATKDPETRSTPSGKNVTTVRLAVNNPLNDKERLFIDVDTWDKQQEFVSKYVKKGSSLSVIGRLKMDEWEKDGKKITKYLVVADRVNFLGGGKKKDADAQSDEFDDAAFAKAAGIEA